MYMKNNIFLSKILCVTYSFIFLISKLFSLVPDFLSIFTFYVPRIHLQLYCSTVSNRIPTQFFVISRKVGILITIQNDTHSQHHPFFVCVSGNLINLLPQIDGENNIYIYVDTIFCDLGILFVILIDYHDKQYYDEHHL